MTAHAPSQAWSRYAKKISYLSLDVDGVMTDGRLYYSATGEALKAFHARDGHALKLWHQLGYHSLIISGRDTAIVKLRAQELGIEHVFLGIGDKLEQMHSFCKQTSTALEAIAHMGDDLPDLPIMQAVGLSISVADGHASVRERAHLVTYNKGGNGAVSEAVTAILAAKGEWDGALQRILARLLP